MKCIDHLQDDHKLILRALCILDEMACRVEQGQKLHTRNAGNLILFLKGFADRFHQGKEEGVFFPALLRDARQEHHSDLRAAVFQHDRQRSLMDGLEESIRIENSSEFVYFARRLSHVLRDHVEEEEQSLFSQAASALTPTEDEAVKVEMQEYELLWQNKNLPGLIQNLVELEASYISKPAA
jgi:hemerythrin-like domain-containing protein